MAVHGTEADWPALVTNEYVDGNVDTWTAHLKAQHIADWIFYQPRTSEEHLQPHEFRIAMAIRCRTLPKQIRDRVQTRRCNCGYSPLAIEECVDHMFRCTSARYNFSHRHNDVKYAIARVLREFGVQSTVESGFYNYPMRTHRSPPTSSFVSRQIPANPETMQT